MGGLYKPNDAYCKEFVTSNPTTGAAANADSLPAATANRNGADDGAFALAVTNLDAGRYKVTGTIPGGYAKGDVVNVSVAATVSGVAGKAVVDTFVLDGKRVGDLNDAAAVSAAAVATAVWTDPRGGPDFAAAGSIGQLLGTFSFTGGNVNANAQATAAALAFNLTGSVTGSLSGSVGSVAAGVNVTQVAGSTSAAAKLGSFYGGLADGVVQSSPPPTAAAFAGPNSLSAQDNFYAKCYLQFLTGLNAGICREVLSYLGSTRTLTLAAAFPAIPSAGDEFFFIGLGP